MPSNVTMHQPGTGVISLEGDEHPTLRRQHSYITSDGVVAVQSWDVGGWVEGIWCLRARCRFRRPAQNKEIMSLLSVSLVVAPYSRNRS
jgi:hypothetical protein